MENRPYAGAFITFRHDVGTCGCEFQTKIDTLQEHPDIVCPGCAEKNRARRTELLKELGDVAARFHQIKSELARDHHFVILGGLGVKAAV